MNNHSIIAVARKHVIYTFLLVSMLLVPVSMICAQAGGIVPVRSAQGTVPVAPPTTATLQNPLTKVTSIGDLVKSGLQVFSYIAVLFAVMMLIVVGFQYIMARGNPEAVTKASMWLLYIVIGLAIVIGARIAVTIVINTMSATGVVDPNVIQSAQNANSIN